LDQGRLVESGEPHELLQLNSGIFSGMVAQTGPSSSAHLREVARVASLDRAASRTALQLHQQHQWQQQQHGQHHGLHHSFHRMQSEVLGRRYVDNPVQPDDGAAGEGGSGQAGLVYGASNDLSRYGCQVRRLFACSAAAAPSSMMEWLGGWSVW
jgi:hypothetical protein